MYIINSFRFSVQPSISDLISNHNSIGIDICHVHILCRFWLEFPRNIRSISQSFTWFPLQEEKKHVQIKNAHEKRENQECVIQFRHVCALPIRLPRISARFCKFMWIILSRYRQIENMRHIHKTTDKKSNMIPLFIHVNEYELVKQNEWNLFAASACIPWWGPFRRSVAHNHCDDSECTRRATHT